MKAKTYERLMKERERQFDKNWQKIVKLTNEFIKDNPEKTMYSLNQIEKFADSMSLSGAWVYDRINGLKRDDRGSVTKKIRKALGFTY